MSDEPPVVDDPEENEKREARAAARLARRRARASIPAIYIDTWFPLAWEGHVRVTMGEWLAGTANYRMAFVMEISDAKEFATELLDAIRIQEEEAEAAKSASLPEGGS